MSLSTTKKKYIQLTKYYQDMSTIKKRTARAHYKTIIDVYPAFGLYLTLFALLIDKIFFDGNQFESVIKIFLLIFILALSYFIGKNVQDASVHISVIDDTEKEIKIKS